LNPVKLVVFGGTGRTGVFIVREALAANHDVTVVARTPSKVTERHSRLEVVRGDVTDGESVATAVAGKDGVISAIGAPSLRAPITIHRVGIANILAAMKQTGVRRLVAISSAGHYEGHDPNSSRFFEWIIRPFLRPLYEDLHAMDALITTSAVDWTILRPPRLMDTPALGRAREAPDVWVMPKGLVIPRADLAAVVVAKVADRESVGHFIAVAT
jgi:putative NADH-flavin reductase